MLDRLRRIVEEQDLEFALPVFERYARPAVGFQLEPDSATAVGSSRLGGGADVPIGFAWPIHNGRPLDFVLQVNLANVPPVGEPWLLPKEGTLAFFYDLEDQPWGFDPASRNGSHVAYFEPGVDLQRHPAVPTEDPLAPARLVFYPMLTLPHLGSLYGEPMWQEVAELRGRKGDEDTGEELASSLAEAYHPSGATTQHRLGGYPFEIQNPMEVEAQFVTHGMSVGDSNGSAGIGAKQLLDLKEGSSEWQLLLQLDSDEDGGFMWGDLGMLYYWLRRSDLNRRSFDRTWMTLQCG